MTHRTIRTVSPRTLYILELCSDLRGCEFEELCWELDLPMSSIRQRVRCLISSGHLRTISPERVTLTSHGNAVMNATHQRILAEVGEG